MFLLDTNVLSEFTKKRPNRHVLAWADWATSSHRLAIPFGAVFELQRGIESLRLRNPSRAHDLSRWLNEVLETDMVFLAMDAAVARTYASMTTVPSLRHLWVPSPQNHRRGPGQDLAIAATAIVYRIPVVSMDVHDFLRIHAHFELPGLFNPIEETWEVPMKRDLVKGPSARIDVRSLETPSQHLRCCA
ncbi:PIN domain-containing protein [Mesorhizobium sp. M0293]|uniref:PIN domain-containing protein n=1 Tax=Mesorhizobium sp. M0293 TaxID=2956930 RepID=UPI003336A37D